MKIVAIAVAIVIVAGLIMLGAKSAYDAGHQAARVETLEKAVDLVQERDKLNVTVRNATAADICRRLGGRMLEDGECG
jgi:hypothetical protein